jgi:hypothetical protein
MNAAIVIHGMIAEKRFISDEPMPDVEGPAELIVYPKGATELPPGGRSMFEFFGKAPLLRSAEDIDAQVREEHDAW